MFTEEPSGGVVRPLAGLGCCDSEQRPHYHGCNTGGGTPEAWRNSTHEGL